MSALGDFPGGPVPPMQRVQVPSLVGEQRFHRPETQNREQKHYFNKFNNDF